MKNKKNNEKYVMLDELSIKKEKQKTNKVSTLEGTATDIFGSENIEIR